MPRLISVPRAGAIAALLGTVAFALVAPATAAPVLVNAELRVEITGLAAVTLNDTGNIDVTGGVYSIPAAFLAQTGPISVPVTTSSAVHSLEAIGLSNLVGSLYAGGALAQAPGEVCVPLVGQACVSGGGVGGVMGVNGLLNVNIIPSIVVFPLDLAGLQLGQGGAGSTPFTYDAAVWTTRTAQVNTGSAILSTQGSTTPNGGLSLVTASFIGACGNLLPMFARLTLTPVVPEPSTLAMVVFGLVGAAILLRRG